MRMWLISCVHSDRSVRRPWAWLSFEIRHPKLKAEALAHVKEALSHEGLVTESEPWGVISGQDGAQ